MKAMIIGPSGSGKSTSLRNLVPECVGVVGVAKKPLPFRSKKIETFYSDNYEEIKVKLKQWAYPIVVIDDAQYILANEFMRRSSETGYTKFTELAKKFWELLNFIDEQIQDEKTVYILSHTEKDIDGFEKIKTIGKLLDEKITIEGMFTVVLKSVAIDGVYQFSTQTNNDTVKSPMGMFDNLMIDNDLAFVDKKIREYYELPSLESLSEHARKQSEKLDEEKSLAMKFEHRIEDAKNLAELTEIGKDIKTIGFSDGIRTSLLKKWVEKNTLLKQSV